MNLRESRCRRAPSVPAMGEGPAEPVPGAAPSAAGLPSRPGRPAKPLARSFLADSGGATAVEVGLLGLPFFTLLVGVLALGFMMWASSTLDFATQKAARQIMTGSLQSANTTATQFQTSTLCGYLPSSVFDCTKLVVNLKTVTESAEPTGWYNFVKTDKSALSPIPMNNSSTSFCLGAGSAYQVLEVAYPFPIFSKSLATASALLSNQIVVMSTAAFKNEPFQGGGVNSGAC